MLVYHQWEKYEDEYWCWQIDGENMNKTNQIDGKMWEKPIKSMAKIWEKRIRCSGKQCTMQGCLSMKSLVRTFDNFVDFTTGTVLDPCNSIGTVEVSLCKSRFQSVENMNCGARLNDKRFCQYSYRMWKCTESTDWKLFSCFFVGFPQQELWTKAWMLSTMSPGAIY